MGDLTIAIIIVGSFLAIVCGVFADGFIREWIAETRMRNSYAGKIDDLMRKGLDI